MPLYNLKGTRQVFSGPIIHRDTPTQSVQCTLFHMWHPLCVGLQSGWKEIRRTSRMTKFESTSATLHHLCRWTLLTTNQTMTSRGHNLSTSRTRDTGVAQKLWFHKHSRKSTASII